MSVRLKKEKSSFSKCYHVEVFFKKDDCIMENIKAYTLIFGLLGLVEELYFLPEDIIDNSETSTEIQKNGLNIFLRTKMEYEQLENHLKETPSLEKLTLMRVDESSFEPFVSVPENVQPLKPEPILKQKNKKMLQCFCRNI